MKRYRSKSCTIYTCIILAFTSQLISKKFDLVYIYLLNQIIKHDKLGQLMGSSKMINVIVQSMLLNETENRQFRRSRFSNRTCYRTYIDLL